MIIALKFLHNICSNIIMHTLKMLFYHAYLICPSQVISEDKYYVCFQLEERINIHLERLFIYFIWCYCCLTK